MHGADDGGSGDHEQTSPAGRVASEHRDHIRSLLEAHHPEWTRSIVARVSAKGHHQDEAVEASQMAFVELWVNPDLFDATRHRAGSSEEGLLRLLRQRATWRAADLWRSARREEPHADVSDASAAPNPLAEAEPGDLLLEPDDSYWIAMNTTKHRYRTRCRAEAISRCLGGEPQRSVARAFEMSAPTLNRQIAFFKERFALLGARGQPAYDVAQITCLRRRGCRLVVMLEREVEEDSLLSPRTRVPIEDGGPAWICEVLGAAGRGGTDG